ncbi:hypothetical protein EDC04DRAFT_2598457 [Pisolithus marmoratus]|nr:hypothetical protein EDC04DRAFT_2598457 [Pisolithus marmoratus]
MPAHHFSYCLKPIPTASGIMWHMSQTPACWHLWKKVIEEPVNAMAVDNENHGNDTVDGMHKLQDRQYEYESDCDDTPKGHFVQYHGAHNETEPCDLGEPQSKHAHIENEIMGDVPNHLGKGCFTKQFINIAAKVLGSGNGPYRLKHAKQQMYSCNSGST